MTNHWVTDKWITIHIRRLIKAQQIINDSIRTLSFGIDNAPELIIEEIEKLTGEIEYTIDKLDDLVAEIERRASGE